MPTGPEWAVTWANVWGAVGALLLIGVGVAAAVKTAKMVAPIVEFFRQFRDDWMGCPERPGIEPRKPGVMETLATHTTQIEAVQMQVTPNHGSSAHDKLNRTINRVDAKVDALFAHLGIEPPEIAPNPPEVD